MFVEIKFFFFLNFLFSFVFVCFISVFVRLHADYISFVGRCQSLWCYLVIMMNNIGHIAQIKKCCLPKNTDHQPSEAGISTVFGAIYFVRAAWYNRLAVRRFFSPRCARVSQSVFRTSASWIAGFPPVRYAGSSPAQRKLAYWHVI